MKITKKEVEHVANLARLSLSGEELDQTTEQLDAILSYMDKLNELDTSQVEATTHVFSISNAFRKDVVQDSLPQSDAVKNGPSQNGEFFQVPKII